MKKNARRTALLSLVIVGALSLVVATALAATTASGNGTLSTSDSTMSGRIFRDGYASTCAGKAFPGTFNVGTTHYYDQFGPFGPASGDTCVTVNFDTESCGYYAHAIAYVDGFNPADIGAGYLGDVGSSVSQPFSFVVPSGHSFYIVVTSTSGDTGLPCTYSFGSDFTGSAPGPDMVYIPPTAVVGQFLVDTPVYWLPSLDTQTTTVMVAGKTAWVYGVDESGAFYRVMLSGKFFWVPVGTMGPNPDAVWHNTPLPTVVIESSSAEAGGAASASD